MKVKLFLNDPELICLHTVKGCQVLIYKTDNLVWHQSFIYVKLNCFKCSKWSNSFIWPIDGTLTGCATVNKIGPYSNGNEKLLYASQSPRTGALSSNTILYHIPDTRYEGLSPM